MDNTESINSSISVDNFFKDAKGFSFWYNFSGFDHFAKITAIADLGDDAGVWLKGDDFVQFNDILQIAEHSKNLHLIIE